MNSLQIMKDLFQRIYCLSWSSLHCVPPNNYNSWRLRQSKCSPSLDLIGVVWHWAPQHTAASTPRLPCPYLEYPFPNIPLTPTIWAENGFTTGTWHRNCPHHQQTPRCIHIYWYYITTSNRFTPNLCTRKSK